MLARHTTRVTIEPQSAGRFAVRHDGEIVVIGAGAVLCAAARKLIAQGHDPAGWMEAWRDDVVCLTGLLGDFAKLTVQENEKIGPRFAIHRPFPVNRSAKGEVFESEGTDVG